MSEEFKCENCKDDTQDYLIEGWFYTEARLNPWAQGTASAGLMQQRILCSDCVEDFKEKGLWCGNTRNTQ